MIIDFPFWIELAFLLTTAAAIALFYFSNGKPRMTTSLIVFYSLVQLALAYSGFYLNTQSVPPRFGFVLIPAAIIVVYGLTGKRKTWILQNRNIARSTFLHTVRIPVELVLLSLFTHKMIPKLMTFEGMNFDILIGLTAPVIGYLIIKKKISKPSLLLWNVLGLILVSVVLVIGILSSELPFQQFAFDQPNRGLAYIPFILLPATIVPIVIWTHSSDIIKLRNAESLQSLY